MPKKASLLWVDLEMTGLSPAEDRILEVAASAEVEKVWLKFVDENFGDTVYLAGN